MPGLDERDFYEEIQSVNEERRVDLQDLAGGENHDIPWFPPKPVAYLGLPYCVACDRLIPSFCMR
jgi:hypothetical protein